MLADRRRRGEQPDGKVNETERAELVRLRREKAELRMEKEILKKAAAFFATESTESRGSASSTGSGRPTP